MEFRCHKTTKHFKSPEIGTTKTWVILFIFFFNLPNNSQFRRLTWPKPPFACLYIEDSEVFKVGKSPMVRYLHLRIFFRQKPFYRFIDRILQRTSVARNPIFSRVIMAFLSFIQTEFLMPFFCRQRAFYKSTIDRKPLTGLRWTEEILSVLYRPQTFHNRKPFTGLVQTVYVDFVDLIWTKDFFQNFYRQRTLLQVFYG